MQRIPRVTTEDVDRIIRRDFAPADQDSVRSLLSAYPPASRIKESVPRVHLAILKLSNHSLERVRANVELANVDFRDVLALAEYPEALGRGFGQSDERVDDRDWEQYREWLERG